MGEVLGIVVGAMGEGSEGLHSLIYHLANSRVRVAGPQLGKRGQLRSEEAEIALTTSFIRRTLSVCAVKGQASTLLGRLEVLGPGAANAARRRSVALHQERRWDRLRRVEALSAAQGRSILTLSVPAYFYNLLVPGGVDSIPP